ncbi:MAG: hypothetical protein INF43_03335 [Alphaproteobacteria bacterium]|jgi:hypothetical protein|nr:hypothetical protein [Alphaproteobacteria bacterium]
MMRVWLTVVLGALVVAKAQAVVLWNVPNEASPTMVPPYRGEGSPFPQPKVEEIADTTDEAARLAAQRRLALTKAQRLVAAPSALQLNASQLRVRGVTNGAAGVRVLVRDNWVGLKETIAVRYAINPVVAEALRELRVLDEDAAARLQARLNERRRELDERGVKITDVNTKNKQMSLETPQGIQKLPLVLEP